MDDSSPPDEPQRWQYRITYDRKGWANPRLQYHADRERVDAFVARQLADHPSRTPLTKLYVERRPVGTWERVDIGTGE